MNVDLRLLRYFVATADEGSANRAAAVLHVTQPVLSRQLRKLETQMGLVLFRRDGRSLRLTAAGRAFLARARPLLRDAALLEEAARRLASGGLEQVHLAVPATTLTDVVAPFLATLSPADPVPLLRGPDPRGALGAIEAGADLAVVHTPAPPALACAPLAVLPVLAHVRRDDPWAGRDSVDLVDLVGRPLVLMTDRFRSRVLLDRALESAGLAVEAALECTDAQVAQALAAGGRGVAVVSDDPRFDLVALPVTTPDGPLRIRLYAAWDREHHAAATLADLARRLSAFCVQRYGPGVDPAADDRAGITPGDAARPDGAP